MSLPGTSWASEGSMNFQGIAKPDLRMAYSHQVGPYAYDTSSPEIDQATYSFMNNLLVMMKERSKTGLSLEDVTDQFVIMFENSMISIPADDIKRTALGACFDMIYIEGDDIIVKSIYNEHTLEIRRMARITKPGSAPPRVSYLKLFTKLDLGKSIQATYILDKELVEELCKWDNPILIKTRITTEEKGQALQAKEKMKYLSQDIDYCNKAKENSFIVGIKGRSYSHLDSTSPSIYVLPHYALMVRSVENLEKMIRLREETFKYLFGLTKYPQQFMKQRLLPDIIETFKLNTDNSLGDRSFTKLKCLDNSTGITGIMIMSLGAGRWLKKYFEKKEVEITSGGPTIAFTSGSFNPQLKFNVLGKIENTSNGFYHDVSDVKSKKFSTVKTLNTLTVDGEIFAIEEVNPDEYGQDSIDISNIFSKVVSLDFIFPLGITLNAECGSQYYTDDAFKMSDKSGRVQMEFTYDEPSVNDSIDIITTDGRTKTLCIYDSEILDILLLAVERSGSDYTNYNYREFFDVDIEESYATAQIYTPFTFHNWIEIDTMTPIVFIHNAIKLFKCYSKCKDEITKTSFWRFNLETFKTTIKDRECLKTSMPSPFNHYLSKEMISFVESLSDDTKTDYLKRFCGRHESKEDLSPETVSQFSHVVHFLLQVKVKTFYEKFVGQYKLHPGVGILLVGTERFVTEDIIISRPGSNKCFLSGKKTICIHTPDSAQYSMNTRQNVSFGPNFLNSGSCKWDHSGIVSILGTMEPKIIPVEMLNGKNYFSSDGGKDNYYFPIIAPCVMPQQYFEGPVSPFGRDRISCPGDTDFAEQKTDPLMRLPRNEIANEYVLGVDNINFRLYLELLKNPDFIFRKYIFPNPQTKLFVSNFERYNTKLNIKSHNYQNGSELQAIRDTTCLNDISALTSCAVQRLCFTHEGLYKEMLKSSFFECTNRKVFRCGSNFILTGVDVLGIFGIGSDLYRNHIFV